MMLQLLLHLVDITLSILFVHGLGWGVPGAAFGTVIGQGVAALVGLAILTQHYGGLTALLKRIAPGELRDAAAIRRMFGLSRDLMIRSMALMGAYAWFAAQGSRMGEVALSANAILLNLLMIVAFFQDGIAQGLSQDSRSRIIGRCRWGDWRSTTGRTATGSLVRHLPEGKLSTPARTEDCGLAVQPRSCTRQRSRKARSAPSWRQHRGAWRGGLDNPCRWCRTVCLRTALARYYRCWSG